MQWPTALPPQWRPRRSTQRAPVNATNQTISTNTPIHDNRITAAKERGSPDHELVDAEPERAHELLVDLRGVPLREVRHIRRRGRGRRRRQRRHASPRRDGEEAGARRGGGKDGEAAGGGRREAEVGGRVLAAGRGEGRIGVGGDGGGGGGGGGEEEWHCKGEACFGCHGKHPAVHCAAARPTGGNLCNVACIVFVCVACPLARSVPLIRSTFEQIYIPLRIIMMINHFIVKHCK